MTILSSRPSAEFEYTDDDLLDAIAPTVNLLNWLSSKTVFNDSDLYTVGEGKKIIEELIGCFEFPDYLVTPVPGTLSSLTYEIAVRPFDFPKYVTFRASFRVK